MNPGDIIPVWWQTHEPETETAPAITWNQATIITWFPIL